ncbi:hypothetical protein ANOM_000218 [Aspergillus nomiae NRRL 13137]|uniref:Uncharacterized protein n=1 Tax=Aspergillus nomiae NRRL (strain ATCC 15546 / NRRL 13137 / CBS 260.88 / M93) TaxID=1509407 RepID=A0A0L1JIY0_ASPN3|nr:uncharacterized protein ANOM_000218 [Aspergillus nomiae NRRL 13137]KNG91724.1 hypothetical protein ANOM_000218 [Aspergillus nomiae NRRL 13137]
MRRTEEAGENPKILEPDCITAGKHSSPSGAVWNGTNESERVKLIKEKPIEYTEKLSLKTDEGHEYTLYDIPEKVPPNREDADVILIDDEEYPNELEHEAAAEYDAKIADDVRNRTFKRLCWALHPHPDAVQSM